jgi:large exoprotein involved in heme utilization and adhesion
MTQGARISADTTGTGTGGDVFLKTTEAIALSDDSEISSNVASNVSGTAGSLRIETGKLIVRDGARVLAAINGKGQEGTLTVTAKDSVELSGTGSGLFTENRFLATSIGVESIGQPTTSTAITKLDGYSDETKSYSVGEQAITTEQGETLTTTVVAAAETTGQGIVGGLAIITEQGETLTVSALGPAELISITSDSRFSAGIEAIPNARAVGDLTIETGKLIVRDGAAVSTATYGEGQGGNLAVRARESVELMGSSSLNTSTSATGAAGDLTIATGKLSVRDGAQVNVSSQGLGSAGNLEVEADSIRLDNQALLNADTKAGQGNIFLRSGDLVLSRGSNITTNATGTAVGGNITIDTGVIAALENSDISANAEEAFGGRIVIDAQGIFGTEFRNQTTPLSDITATSRLGPKFSGTVEINILDIDPSQGLATLPTALVDASNRIATSCATVGDNKFVITGRGGLPPSPSEVLSSDAVWVDFGTLNPKVENSSRLPVSTNPTAPESAPIVEARGWVINGKGEVVLTANAPTTTPHNPWMTAADCHTPQASS